MKYININSDSRNNNFNLIRILAAIAVLISHSFVVVKGFAEADPLFKIINETIGGVAVDIFFVVSGFLVTRSLINRKSISKYLKARALRIYPALIMALILIVFVLGPIFTNLEVSDYFNDTYTQQYLARNIFTLGDPFDFLPGVFENNHFPFYISGQLWTISYEIVMYLILALAGMFSILISNKIKANDIKYIIITIFIITFYINLYYHFDKFTTNTFNLSLFNDTYHFFVMYFIEFCSFFCFGSLLYFYRNKIKIPFIFIITFPIVIVIATLNLNIFYLLYAIFMPLFVIGLAYLPFKPLHIFNKAGDYSYGIYIYAFPVQQSFVALFPEISIVNITMLSLVCTFILAFASWHLLEKRMLKLKKMEQATM